MTTFHDAVKEVKAYISDKLKDDLDDDQIADFAAEYVWHGMENGDDGRGQMHAEIAGDDSKSGNPVPFSFFAVDDDA